MTFQRKYYFLDTIARENPLYKKWQRIRSRCYCEGDKSYDRYGGRGITMCDEWKNNFKAFYDWAMNNGYKDELSIERLDVNQGYYPENCAWITMTEQARNKRNTHWVEYKGEKKCLAEVAEIEGIHKHNFYTWVEKYDTIEEAIRVGKSNKQGLRASNKTGFVGVYPRGNRWFARYGKQNVGTFDTMEEAVKAREKFIEKHKKGTK